MKTEKLNGSARLNHKPIMANEDSHIAGLSPKESKVFNLLGEGESIKEIAGDLGIGYFTVITHLKRIKQKLKIPDQRKLLVAAIKLRAGLL